MTERGRARLALDVALIVATIAFALASVSATVERTRRNAARDSLTREAQQLYDAIERYRQQHGAYPATHGEGSLDPQTLEPLRRRGYYTGRLLERLRGGRLDGYEAPAPDEFWLEMTAADDATMRLVLARSNDAPAGGGAWLEGLYVYENQQLAPR